MSDFTSYCGEEEEAVNGGTNGEKAGAGAPKLNDISGMICD